MKRSDLLKLIAWPLVMKQSRCAGGHDDVMQSIFGSNAPAIAHWNEGDYQGTVITAYLFSDGYVGIISDSFGSCSGCDGWEDATDKDAKAMVTSLVTSCRLFRSIAVAANFCSADMEAENYHFQGAKNLAEPLKKMAKIKRNSKSMPLYINDENYFLRTFVRKSLAMTGAQNG